MKFIRKKLSSGITLLHEPRELPLVSLSITNKFGALYEPSDIKGIAHFIEHLLFTGTKTRTHEDISREIEKRGGLLNAFTDQNITSYWFKLPSEHVMVGLGILVDMIANPAFKEEKFEKEKKVIIEEIKMYHDDPSRHIYEKILENLYEKPLGEGIIGSKETITKVTRQKISDYFDQVYGPENYIVTIIGKADLDQVTQFLENSFLKKSRKFQSQKIKEKNAHTVEKRAGLDQAHFVFGMHVPRAGSRRTYDYEVLDAYLANGMSSRLFLTIREERGLAYSVRSSFDVKKEYAYYTIYVGTTKEAIPEVESLIKEGFKVAETITEQDIKGAKERLIGLQKVASEESINVMNELTYAESSTKAEDYYEYEKNIRNVKLEDVRRCAKLGEYSTAAIIPE